MNRNLVISKLKMLEFKFNSFFRLFIQYFILYQIPFILWMSILILTGNEWCSVIQVTLLLVKWHVGC
jgi:hypothetical protein